MTDIRTAAQAIDAAIFQKGYVNSKNKKDLALIEALRLALAAPVELVGEIHDIDHFHMAVWKNGTPDVGTKLYTTPPSIDALIAEIDGLEVQVFEISSPPWTEEAYSKDDIKAILDKYRAKDKT